MLLENISKKCHQKRLLVSIPAHNPTSKAGQHSIRPTLWNKYHILFEQIRHRTHFIIVTIIHLLSQNNQITIF